MRKFIVGAAAAALVAGSSVAQAAPVAIDARAGSAVGDAEDLRGRNGAHVLLGLLAAIVFGFVVFQVIDDGDDDALPTSP